MVCIKLDERAESRTGSRQFAIETWVWFASITERDKNYSGIRSRVWVSQYPLAGDVMYFQPHGGEMLPRGKKAGNATPQGNADVSDG